MLFATLNHSDRIRIIHTYVTIRKIFFNWLYMSWPLYNYYKKNISERIVKKMYHELSPPFYGGESNLTEPQPKQ